MKLLTVAVPSYNVEATLARTLDSLCVEPFLDKLDIVVGDDGSADATREIALSYAERFPQAVRVITQPNGGHGAAVNTGIREARGQYFRVVDGDDRLTQEGLAARLGALEGCECDLVATDYAKVPDDGGALIPMPFKGLDGGRVYRFEELPAEGLYFGIHSSTFRTALLRRHGVALQEHTFYVDTEFCLLPIPFVQTVLYLHTVLYLYTVGREGQSIDPAAFVRRYDDHDRVVRRLAAFYEGASCPDAQKDYIRRTLDRLLFTHYMLSACYDADRARGRARSRAFDAWLRGASPALYASVGRSGAVRFLRVSGFRFLPGARLGAGIRSVFSRAKRLLGGRRRFTY